MAPVPTAASRGGRGTKGAGTPADGAGMRNLDECRDLPALADHVWAERALVERLHYKLVAANLVLSADLRHFVPRALEEVDDVVGALAEAEHHRERAVEVVAAAWGVPPAELTLRRLADEAPEPWSALFEDHHAAFTDLAEEIRTTAAENQRLATTALHSIRTALGALTGPTTEAYTARGRATPLAPVAPLRVDRTL